MKISNAEQLIASFHLAEKQFEDTTYTSYWEYPKAIHDFLDVIAASDWLDHDYQPGPALSLFRNQAATAQASINELRSVLTAFLRGERFCEGFWYNAFKKGHIKNTINRLSVLNSECKELETRVPVWQALAELFLDKELTPNDFERLAVVINQSNYSTGEIKTIFCQELYPVLIKNLRSPAGEWSGFDSNWLVEQIKPRMNVRPKFKLPMMYWGLVKNQWYELLTYLRQHKELNENEKE